ncbi:type II toxin-antitoxin system RelE/ParE family toxin [Hyphobacterium sp. HN65]|uniref:Type II toxin-antitoxin system RelE/ParE family toxin n=1 Tax=Hyphobacterium lacteum TaxID=3116575 RepID=A0ABU7LN42_9PROT|nr:type II toxin-antitoxin system RelE/ParE family toxin [Hyphobacterium sp. HN65]MEE2525336.1 type II toxin-antitoxin system RelE/ParE family toxin [Hyphobacterium sp. HN65]
MSYRLRFHPAVADDLDEITRWLIDYAGPDAAARRLDEIETAIASLADLPHKGSVRDEIAPGLRAIPAGRKAVIAFSVDDAAREVFIHAVTYAGADWMARRRAR